MTVEVMGFGALNLDYLYRVNRIAGPDEEAHIQEVKESCGGSAANTIVALSQLGLKTGFLGKIGQDREGKILLQNMKQERVDTSNIMISRYGRSGTVQGFVDPEGERALYVDPGVNDEILPLDIEKHFKWNPKLIHLSSFVGKSLEAQKTLMKMVDEAVKVSLDPGMIYAEKGLKVIEDILYRTNILLLNLSELKRLVPNSKNLREKIDLLLEYGIDILVVKKGAHGCEIYHGQEHYEVNAMKVECLDSTGAGDAFNAGFIYGYLKGKAIEESAILGNFVASCCIQGEGATNCLPHKNQLPIL
jgi:sugar/nucleoside kinase (ribokinase family)